MVNDDARIVRSEFSAVQKDYGFYLAIVFGVSAPNKHFLIRRSVTEKEVTKQK